jgi:predicted Zn-dependent peptidase
LYRKTILGNGIRVVTEHIPYVRSVTIGFWFRTGSRDEGAENNGVSHFIEHMVFKGTTTRSAREIAETVDAAGGQLNAFTSKEHTCFYVRVLDGHLRLGVQVLSDMLLNSRFDACEMDKEKGVVIEEIRMYEDCPDELVQAILQSSQTLRCRAPSTPAARLPVKWQRPQARRPAVQYDHQDALHKVAPCYSGAHRQSRRCSRSQ